MKQILNALLAGRLGPMSRLGSAAPGGRGLGLGRTDGKFLAQLANIIMLRSMSRLGALDEPPSPSGQAGPPGLDLMAILQKAAEQRAAPARPSFPVGSVQNLTPPAQRPAPTTAPARAAAPEAAADRAAFDRLIDQAAARHQVDPALVRAVVQAESDFDPACVSQAGAMGLMQLMPETAGDLGVSDPFDPAQNIDAGTRYLSMMLQRFGGDESRALAAYNWGPSNVESGGRYPAETRNYLRKVAALKHLHTQGLSAQA